MDRLRRYWTRTNSWVKAVLLAACILLSLHVLVLRWITVRSTSMFATLVPGDLVGVQRWPVWTGFERGDVAVFRDPLEDRHLMTNRRLLVKRIVGLPGDRVELRKGRLFVNDVPLHFPDETRSYLVRLKRGTDPQALLRELGLPPAFVPADRSVIELALNDSMARVLEERPEVVQAQVMSTASGAPRHIFPFSPYFKWNGDNYGPIAVPAKGDTVPINVATIPMFDRIISRYEGHGLEADRNDLRIDGVKATHYTIEQDYYFVLGDCRHYSADSRYWGFVPADHLVGRAGFILLGSDAGARPGGRWFRSL
ncbi:MAG TPA: signal peptidase I [Flavobacteriales bacterium]